MNQPVRRPKNTNFSSGPCAKRPGWSFQNLALHTLGRSHRSRLAKSVIEEVIQKSKSLLGLPPGYELGIVPASDTGAIEMALWNFLGDADVERRGVDVAAFENFGYEWVSDIEKQLRIKNLRKFIADYGKLPDLTQLNGDRDVVFTWNGTTSGVCVPDANWIKADRKGLTICDATSAVFAMEIDWSKIDVLTYSWQKSMGGEGAHGVLILSPKAIARLAANPPVIGLPKIFQIMKNGRLNTEIFQGATINTPSMLCVEDALDALNWMMDSGGLPAMIRRSKNNLKAIKEWLAKSSTFSFLAENERTISNTSVCLRIKSAWYRSLDTELQTRFAKDLAGLLEKEKVAFDVGSYRDAPPGLRIWCGATVDSEDVEALLAWIDWAYAQLAREPVQ
jgi:phosphoserine aminotransferase